MEQNFKIAIIKKGISQNELAARVGLHPSALSRAIHGWFIPRPDVQAAILNELAPFNKGLRFGYRLRLKK